MGRWHHSRRTPRSGEVATATPSSRCCRELRRQKRGGGASSAAEAGVAEAAAAAVAVAAEAEAEAAEAETGYASCLARLAAGSRRAWCSRTVAAMSVAADCSGGERRSGAPARQEVFAHASSTLIGSVSEASVASVEFGVT